jgi:hypothetical protein
MTLKKGHGRGLGLKESRHIILDKLVPGVQGRG